jgi:hypothetical protein
MGFQLIYSGNSTEIGRSYISVSDVVPKNISCQMYNASYNIEFMFNNGIQSTIIHSVDLMYPYVYPL